MPAAGSGRPGNGDTNSGRFYHIRNQGTASFKPIETDLSGPIKALLTLCQRLRRIIRFRNFLSRFLMPSWQFVSLVTVLVFREYSAACQRIQGQISPYEVLEIPVPRFYAEPSVPNFTGIRFKEYLPRTIPKTEDWFSACKNIIMIFCPISAIFLRASVEYIKLHFQRFRTEAGISPNGKPLFYIREKFRNLYFGIVRRNNPGFRNWIGSVLPVWVLV